MDEMKQEEQLESAEKEISLKQLNNVSGMNSINKKLILVAVIEACVLLMLSFAWYYYVSNRQVLSEDREIMVPYYLYLLDENKTDYFQLQVVNMHPDETKQVVVCVSNKDKDNSDLTYSIGRQSEFNYELEFAYTQNIPLDYTVYELKPVSLDSNGEPSEEDKLKDLVYTDSGNVWEKVTDSNNLIKPLDLDTATSQSETSANNQEMYGDTSVVNIGQYDIYSTDAKGELLQLKTTLNGEQSEYEYDYYLIEINWKSDVVTFSQYLKETDLVYVIVKAVQPRPEVKE